MATGNTFGATALSSYGGFWIAYGLLFSPTWGIMNTTSGPYADEPAQVNEVIGFFLFGWFIFTTVMLICTLRTTVAFVFLFATLDIAFLCLACENFAAANGNASAKDHLQTAGGVFGILAAFAAWYNALAGLLDRRYVIYGGYYTLAAYILMLTSHQQLILLGPRWPPAVV